MLRNSLYAVLVIGLLFTSCRKLIEHEQKNALISVMTNGHWTVENYTANGQPITFQFNGYSFYFHENGTVNAVFGSQTTAGTWAGNIPDCSIISAFPAADDPLKRLNGTWKITDSGMDFVQAHMVTEEGENILHLEKGF